MEQKKFTDVVRLGHKSTQGVLSEGDYIVIQEKIDGANASFTVNNDELYAFSRKTLLSDENTLGGFYSFVFDSFNEKKELLNEDYIYFGEWTNPHKVKYEGYEKQFFLFDIWDKRVEKYLSFDIVESEATRLNLNLVPIFYEGEYQSFEHLQSFVGKTKLNGKLGDLEAGEGIVVKNITYIDRFGKQLFVKLVTDAFAEVQKQKKPKNPDFTSTKEYILAESVATVARIEKLLYKLQDESIISTPIEGDDIKVIFKELNLRTYDDILKEELDSLDGIDMNKFKKHVSTIVNKIIRDILKEKGVI